MSKIEIYNIVKGSLKGYQIKIEDLWEKVSGIPWNDCRGNPAAFIYAERCLKEGLPIDNDVYYGKINGSGYLVHKSEIDWETICVK